MPNLEIEVIRVQGKCSADLREGDRFEAHGPHITPVGHDRNCQVALASVVLNAGRALCSVGDPRGGGARGRSTCISCMDPGTGDGGNVLFRVGLGNSRAGDLAAEPGTAPEVAPKATPNGRMVFFQPVEIHGTCPAGLTISHRWAVRGMSLVAASVDDGRICLAATSHWLPSLWQLQGGRRFFAHTSCPGCMVPGGSENRVVFLGGHADKWGLCRVISAYLRAVRVMGENEAARACKLRAMEMQDQGDYRGARRQMVQALRAVRSGQRR